ncbi:enoyl-CoA hydratase/isomerase family protein [Gordonia bronchialis]|uniref:enoyl-CoA hydratase/isomerase family protein n=1 Tax=Gordonia bronchialis TaxID=2054 RepID=UPI002430A2CA|nr:enoyl-CoA hydratase/isomerase family protein [Gordonia bronchialis]
MGRDDSLFRRLIDEGDAPDAPRRVLVEEQGDRAIITLCEPERLNVLSAPLVRQLRRAVADLSESPDIRTIILTGAGPGFCAGGDLQMMDTALGYLDAAEGTTDMWRWIRREFGAIARTIAGADTIFVAALNGPAAGVGLAWALTCDITLASDRAVIVPAFGRLGLLPEVGTTWALTRRLGYQGALSYFLRGEHLDAWQAKEIGLVQEVVDHDQLLAAADDWASRVAALPTHTTAMVKPLLRAGADASWHDGLTLEEFAEPSCFSTQNFATAVRATMSRRGH